MNYYRVFGVWVPEWVINLFFLLVFLGLLADFAYVIWKSVG